MGKQMHIPTLYRSLLLPEDTFYHARIFLTSLSFTYQN